MRRVSYYNHCMTKEEFGQTINRFLENRPSRTLTGSVGFGPFKRTVKTRFLLSDLTLNSYRNFIEIHYQGFEEPGKSAAPDALPDGIILRSSIELPEEIRQVLTQRVTDETFSDMLIRLQNERGIKAPELYRSAGIDFRHYSKIISDRQYQPRKDTVFALGLALKLDRDTSEKFLARAGYSFNPSSLCDMTVRFFFEERIYDRNTIDTLMEAMGLPLLPQNW